jgi:hypothetical protein
MRGSFLPTARNWDPLHVAREFPAIDVTRFVLAELATTDTGASRTTPFFRYRRNKPVRPA